MSQIEEAAEKVKVADDEGASLKNDKKGNRGLIRAFRAGNRNESNEDVGDESVSSDILGVRVNKKGGTTLNNRRSRRTSADMLVQATPGGTMKAGLSASLHGRIGAGLRGIGGIANRSNRATGDASPVALQPAGNRKKFISSMSMSGLPTRATNRRFKDMLRDTPGSPGGEADPVVDSENLEQLRPDGDENEISQLVSVEGRDRRRSAESARSSLSSMLSETEDQEELEPGGRLVHELETMNTESNQVVLTGIPESQPRVDETVRHKSLNRVQATKISAGKQNSFRGGVSDEDDDSDMDDAKLATMVQNMYVKDESPDAPTEQGFIQSSNSDAVIGALHAARASRRASLDSIRMRRASISASLSDKQDVEGHIPSLKQSSFYSASESSHKGISHDDGSRVYRPTSEAHVTRHLSSGSNGSDVSQALSETHQVPNDQVPLNNNGDKSKKDLILSLRQLAESIDGEGFMDESDYTDDDNDKHEMNEVNELELRTEGYSNNQAETSIKESESEEHLTETDRQNIAHSLAMEHRIFLKAVLELLTERERMAVEASLQRDGPDRVVKFGILKKSSQLMKGIWKVKYTEIKNGVFVYYDDDSLSSISRESQVPVRKFIPLVAGEIKIRPVKLKKLAKAHNKSGYFFELSVIPDGPKRLWMTSTREERQSWMKAIDDSIVGGSPFTKSGVFTNFWYSSDNRTASGVDENSPYRHCLDKYIAVQQQLKSASTKQAYMGGLSILWRDPLRIPVQWIRIKIGGLMSPTSSFGGFHAFHEGEAYQSIQQLWKDLVRDSVSINDSVIRGGDGHGPERILGSLTKCIMDHDEARLKNSGITNTARRKIQMNEAQGISYARDILLACNRTRSAGDSYYSMDMLCGNPGLVVLCPVSTEALPLKIIVKLASKEDTSAKSNTQASGPQKSWVMLRGSDKKNNQWQKLFCILSEGVLSYYEKELPTPQKLRGQLILVGAKMGACEIFGDKAMVESEKTRKKLMKAISDSQDSCTDIDGATFQSGRGSNKSQWYLIGLLSKTKAKDVQLCFQAEADFLKWKQSLQCALETLSEVQQTSPGSLPPTDIATIQEESDDPEELDGNQDVKVNGNISFLQSITAGQPTVQVTVEASTAYRICTIDPQGDEDEDTWATIQTKFVQSFRLSGGSSGTITRGEEIVQMLLLRGSASNESFERVLKMKNKSKIGALEGLSMQKFAYSN